VAPRNAQGDKVKASNIYRKAAKLIEDRVQHSCANEGTIQFSCCAVAEAAGIFKTWNYPPNTPSRLVDEYRHIFDGEFSFYGSEDGNNERILALFFMAALAADDERSKNRRHR
jgi:hypothetical protein